MYCACRAAAAEDEGGCCAANCLDDSKSRTANSTFDCISLSIFIVSSRHRDSRSCTRPSSVKTAEWRVSISLDWSARLAWAPPPRVERWMSRRRSFRPRLNLSLKNVTCLAVDLSKSLLRIGFV